MTHTLRTRKDHMLHFHRNAQEREAVRAAELRRGARVIEAQLEERAQERARQEDLREQACGAATCFPGSGDGLWQ